MGTTKANANSELDGRNYRDRSGGISPLWRSLQRHHSGRISCPRTTSDGVPGSGDQSLRAGTANRFSIGCCRWWSARSKRPQWMGMGKSWPLKARKLRNGSFRAHVYVGAEGSEAPTSSTMRSNGPELSPRYREIHTIPRSRRHNRPGDSCR